MANVGIVTAHISPVFPSAHPPSAAPTAHLLSCWQLVALPATGVTQNAFASTPWINGESTMSGYYGRAVLTDGPHSVWNFSAFVPQVVMISLGGNDFNHQGALMPSNTTFDTRCKFSTTTSPNYPTADQRCHHHHLTTTITIAVAPRRSASFS